MTQHLVLLGDSILDNATYVQGRPAVIDQVRDRLPPAWRVTLGARDGNVIVDVDSPTRAAPGDASHLVLSTGGNDVLCEIGLLQEPVGTVGEGLHLLADLRDRFDRDYGQLLRTTRERACPSSSARSTTHAPPTSDSRRGGGGPLPVQ